MKPLPTLETEHLMLRPLSLKDGPVIQKLGGDRRVAEMTLLPHPFSQDEVERWINDRLEWAKEGKSLPFSILLLRSEEMIGHAGLVLDRENEKAELYYWLGVPYWGHGYATELAQELVRHAFEDLHLGRVYADHFARNPASGRVLEKAGMVREGYLRKDFKKWDQLEDLVLCGILHEEYSAWVADSARCSGSPE